jgi:hypothetical protein
MKKKRAMTDRIQCNPHPDAPHGFDRNASHNADRYVCECEGWQPADNAWALAWAPLPLIPEHIKAEMLPAGYARQPEPVEDWQLHAGDRA